MLTEQHIATIKSTIPILEEAGPALTAHFYKRMFEQDPQVKHIFNMSNQRSGGQQAALFEAIAAYAKNIENLGALTAAVERIAHKHTSFNVQAEHYEIVGKHLIGTLHDLLGEAFTQPLEDAWTAAYLFLAKVFIDREEQLYSQNETAQGGWRGLRDFTVVDKIPESKWVTSFVLKPLDGGEVVSYQAGQYLGLQLEPSDSEYKEIRQYSLSDKPSADHYRISVKREANENPGVISNYLHDCVNVGDVVKVMPPAGDFFFVDKNAPVVLISAGVGATPMQAMLETLAAQDYPQSVSYLYACEDKSEHTFAKRTAELTQAKAWQNFAWYRTNSTKAQGVINGLMELKPLAEQLPLADGDFYICGPVAFMQFIKGQLLELGVTETQIHYEVFGPHKGL
ncbi:NO-inducible flavohemoprotein [Saccharobesus litoralis]|uniref:Flavohemoprotein n=1 Tax=Saccharobesus litoralis TaxID=2172099 RepID=A0A2S0VPV0_9ALTE|nr:NO-inducible flavohemoprotein [Saccharobesus litoralis]AWB66234.1 NO-inducible flavohemoprotein [Saccharobesus litoralis]